MEGEAQASMGHRSDGAQISLITNQKAPFEWLSLLVHDLPSDFPFG
mgnify:CR=1 FL=1